MPWPYLKMKLCERFHMTPKEFDEQDAGTILLWIKMISFVSAYENRPKKG